MKLIYKLMILFMAVVVVDGCNDDTEGSSTLVTQQSPVISNIETPNELLRYDKELFGSV